MCLLFLQLVEGQQQTLPPPPDGIYSERFPLPTGSHLVQIPDGRRYWIDPAHRRYLIEQFNGMIAERNLHDVVYETMPPLPPHLLSFPKAHAVFPPAYPPHRPHQGDRPLPSICRVLDQPVRECSNKQLDNITMLVEPLRLTYRGKRVPRQAYPYSHRIMFHCVKVIDQSFCHESGHKHKRTKHLTVNVFVMDADKLVHAQHQEVVVPPHGIVDVGVTPNVVGTGTENVNETETTAISTCTEDAQQTTPRRRSRPIHRTSRAPWDYEAGLDPSKNRAKPEEPSGDLESNESEKKVTGTEVNGGEVHVVRCHEGNCQTNEEDEDHAVNRVMPIQYESLEEAVVDTSVEVQHRSVLLEEGNNSLHDHHNVKREARYVRSRGHRGKAKRKHAPSQKRKSKGKHARIPKKKNGKQNKKHNKKQNRWKGKSKQKSHSKKFHKQSKSNQHRKNAQRRYAPGKVKVRVNYPHRKRSPENEKERNQVGDKEEVSGGSKSKEGKGNDANDGKKNEDQSSNKKASKKKSK
ncbi:hypothetical protein Trydic_g15705 [Trypoxylus dichotomus]